MMSQNFENLKKIRISYLLHTSKDQRIINLLHQTQCVVQETLRFSEALNE